MTAILSPVCQGLVTLFMALGLVVAWAGLEQSIELGDSVSTSAAGSQSADAELWRAENPECRLLHPEDEVYGDDELRPSELVCGCLLRIAGHTARESR